VHAVGEARTYFFSGGIGAPEADPLVFCIGAPECEPFASADGRPEPDPLSAGIAAPETDPLLSGICEPAPEPDPLSWANAGVTRADAMAIGNSSFLMVGISLLFWGPMTGCKANVGQAVKIASSMLQQHFVSG
jgi:hypothetical protein